MVSADDADSDADAALCDFCASEPAVVYCRADSARLCLACDREVHAANTVSSRHNRSLLCDRCASAPAAVFCPSLPHRLVLCSNCDFNARQSDGHYLARQALDPFSGCPSGVFLAAALSVVDEKDALSGKVEERWDWEAPPVFCWEDLILSPTTTPFHGYQAMVVPPPPKNSNSSCGKCKEEIRRQIRQLIIGETDGIDYDEEIVPVMEFKSLPLENLQLQNGPSPVLLAAPSCEGNYIQCNLNDSPMAACNPALVTNEQKIGSSSSVNAAFVDGIMEFAPHASRLGGCDKDQANPAIKEKLSLMQHKNEVPDRSSVISRYKEKRKTRRYDKLIRYESRKTRADSRVRIKGRFAKVNLATNP